MKKIIAYTHSHWDREWYREFEEFRLRLIEVFDEIISALNNNEIPSFYFDGQSAALEDYLEIFPEKEKEIKQLVKEKKLRIGPFYCSADSFLVSGESIYRNLELGIKKSKEFGETDFIGYLSDTFGHSKSIVSILKSFNINKACLWRGLGDLPADLNWDGIDVTYLIQGYFQDFLNLDLSIEKKAELLKKYIDKIAAKSKDYILLPIGADHLALAKNLNEQIQYLNKIYKEYKIELETPFEYFKEIKTRKKVTGEFLNNSLNFILPGVYSSRIYIKQANANSQWLLNNIAEPIQAIGHFFFNTKNKQNEINYAYKTLIKNHAHDSIYGCSTDDVHKEVMMRYKKTDIISNGIIKRTIRDLTDNTKNISVINLGNYEYSGPVKIITEKKLPKFLGAEKIASYKGFTDSKLYNINEIPITEDITNINEYIIDVKNIKPFAITQINKENICSEKNIRFSNNYIENKYIKLEIKNNKITVTDKKTNTKYNDFITITDRADIGDSYNFGPLKNDIAKIAKLNSFKIKENNNKRIILNLKYIIEIPINSTQKGRTKRKYLHTINVDAILYNQAEGLEFNINWINKSKNHILQIGFKQKEEINETINEDLYGTIKRTFNPNYDIYKEIPAQRGKELKPNTAPMQRFMSTNNFCLITKGNNEYEINKNTVNLTLLRATGIISNPKNTSRGTPAGPPIEVEDLQCLKRNNANIMIAFTNKEDDLFRLADYFYGCNIPVFTNKADEEFFTITNKQIRLTSIQTTNEGINIRLYNNSDKKASTQLRYKKNTSNINFQPKEIKNITLNH